MLTGSQVLLEPGNRYVDVPGGNRDNGQPLSATVVCDNLDGTVNLVAHSHVGDAFSMRAVRFVSGSDTVSEGESYCHRPGVRPQQSRQPGPFGEQAAPDLSLHGEAAKTGQEPTGQVPTLEEATKEPPTPADNQTAEILETLITEPESVTH